MHEDPTRNEMYLSQSECRTAQDCGTRWLAEWHRGVRHTTPESPSQRIGSLGHAILAEHLLAHHEQREPDVTSAVIVECERRGYQQGDCDDFYPEQPEEIRRAEWAAETLLSSPKFIRGEALVMTGPDAGPLIEKRVRAGWGMLAARAGLDIGTLAAIFCGHRVGMEGQPDFVHHLDAVTYVDDFKFRQKADLGGAVSQSSLPDGQGAFYKVLLRAVLGPSDGPVVFRQLNVYAGTWLTLDDFLVEGSPYVTSYGIPSRDLKVLGMVDADVWASAWSALVERRRSASLLAHPGKTKGGKVKPVRPKVATEAEQRDAAAFVGTLRTTPLVEVSESRLDHSVCVELVRDMLAAVAGHLALLGAGTLPGRHLRTYPNSPCARRYGCPVQDPCLASLGTNRLDETLTEMAEDGRLRRALRRAEAASIVDYDTTMEAST